MFDGDATWLLGMVMEITVEREGWEISATQSCVRTSRRAHLGEEIRSGRTAGV